MEYKLFGNRLVVQVLSGRHEHVSSFDFGAPVAAPAVPFLPAARRYGAETFGKGRIVSIGQPLTDEADADILDAKELGGPSRGGPDNFLLTQFVGMIGKLLNGGGGFGLGPDLMQPVEIGNVVVFVWDRATELPGECDLVVIEGRGIVGVVTGDDLQLPLPADAGGA